MMAIRAGALRHRLEVQTRLSRDDGAGGALYSWRTTFEPFGNVSTSGGREFVDAKRLIPELTHLVETRFSERIRPDMRVLFGDVVLNVRAAFDPDGRRARLLLICVEEIGEMVGVRHEDDLWLIGQDGVLIGTNGLFLGEAFHS